MNPSIPNFLLAPEEFQPDMKSLRVRKFACKGKDVNKIEIAFSQFSPFYQQILLTT